MGLSRRSILCRGGAAFLSASIVTPAIAAPALVGIRPTAARTLSFNCYNTGEQLKATTYWADGKYIPDALAEVNYALRDYRSGEVYPIEPKVLDLMHQIGEKLDTNCHFEVYSGYRSPKTNAMLRQADSGVAAHSLHMEGLAVDITLPGRSLEQLYHTSLAMHAGGVGYYPDADFLHVDVGRVRRWVGFG
ncbi:MAG TPA: DUF882 domain-containing protein [Rhizomicrobium sp.]|nr:DUF882 domain-containing protein [Rhizomicrobium sp.]